MWNTQNNSNNWSISLIFAGPTYCTMSNYCDEHTANTHLEWQRSLSYCMTVVIMVACAYPPVSSFRTYSLPARVYFMQFACYRYLAFSSLRTDNSHYYHHHHHHHDVTPVLSACSMTEHIHPAFVARRYVQCGACECRNKPKTVSGFLKLFVFVLF